MPDWWKESSRERYWCEITDRPDIGVDLKAPTLNEAGQSYWSYSLIGEVQPGDVVFHYSTRRKAIVGASVAGGPMEERPIVWAPHGTVGRANTTERTERPGIWRPLFHYRKSPTSLTLTALGEGRQWIADWVAAREQLGPLRLPFQLRKDGTMRGGQGYLFKMPADFVDHWDVLSELANALDASSEIFSGSPIYTPKFAPIDGGLKLKDDGDYVANIKAAVQHKTRTHERLVRIAAERLRDLGAVVENQHPKDLEIVSPVSMILEAKITGQRLAHHAAREAVGQLFEYRYFVGPRNALLGLLLDRQPSEQLLAYLESHLNIAVFWVDHEQQIRAGLLGEAQVMVKLKASG